MRKLTIRSLFALAAVAVAALAIAQLGSARTERQTAATATTIQVSGGEFYGTTIERHAA